MATIAAQLWEMIKYLALATALWMAVELLFDPKGKQRVGQFLANLVNGALFFAKPVLTEAETLLTDVAKAFVDSATKHGGAFRDVFVDPTKIAAEGIYQDIETALSAGGLSEPSNAVHRASIATGTAFGLGISSAATAAAFKSVLPKDMNAFDGIAPIIAEMAGFKEVAGHVMDPLYEAAFGKSLQYHYRSLFKPELPDESDAVLWNARGLLKDGQLDRIFQASGLKTEYEEAYKESAYRAVSPFVVARATSTGDMSEDDLKDILKFNGYRDKDILRLIAAFEAVAIEPYRRAALQQFIAAAERGLYTDTALDSELASFKLPKGADNWVKREIAYRRLLQLTNLYEKSISEGYRYKQVSDTEYIPDMENIGLNQADAAARYAIDSIVERGRDAQAAARTAAQLKRQQQGAEVHALEAQYQANVIDEAGLSAGLLLIGIDPQISAAIIELQTARKQAAQVDVYGKIVPRDDAPLLREKVAATKAQVLKKAITPNEGFAALQSYGIPDANARALTAAWEAQALKIAITP